jgi:hypothetical protein
MLVEDQMKSHQSDVLERLVTATEKPLTGLRLSGIIANMVHVEYHIS